VKFLTLRKDVVKIQQALKLLTESVASKSYTQLTLYT